MRRDNLCLAVCPPSDLGWKYGGWQCSLPPGHKGRHAAHLNHDLSVADFATWRDDAPTQEEVDEAIASIKASMTRQ